MSPTHLQLQERSFDANSEAEIASFEATDGSQIGVSGDVTFTTNLSLDDSELTADTLELDGVSASSAYR